MNGGAQIRPREGTTAKDMIAELEAQYDALEKVDPKVDAEKMRDALAGGEEGGWLTTSYKVVEKTVGLGIKW